MNFFSRAERLKKQNLLYSQILEAAHHTGPPQRHQGGQEAEDRSIRLETLLGCLGKGKAGHGEQFDWQILDNFNLARFGL